MTETIAATFANYGAAQLAVERLREAGVPADSISLVGKGVETVEEPVVVERETPTSDGTGVATGGLLGALGGLLVGLGALMIPGVGPFIAAGPLAAALLGGTAIGAATGGLIGALVETGLPEERARVYVTEVQQGRVLLSVRTEPQNLDLVHRLLTQTGAMSLYPEVLPSVVRA